MGRYRKKPVVIEALLWPSDIKFWPEWLRDAMDKPFRAPTSFQLRGDGSYAQIVTLEGTMVVDPGDWIIRGVNGELYPCKPDIFEATYERVEEEIAT